MEVNFYGAVVVPPRAEVRWQLTDDLHACEGGLAQLPARSEYFLGLSARAHQTTAATVFCLLCCA
jgi:hypothetical protein